MQIIVSACLIRTLHDPFSPDLCPAHTMVSVIEPVELQISVAMIGAVTWRKTVLSPVPVIHVVGTLHNSSHNNKSHQYGHKSTVIRKKIYMLLATDNKGVFIDAT